MIPGRLRLRFVVAAGLLVLTTVTASVWTFFALTRLSSIVTDTVRQSESVTAVTSRLAGALEREDDAVLLILAGDARGTQVLTRERGVVDRAVADLFDVLGPNDERELATPLQEELRTYRQAADSVVSVAPERDALVQYHQKANPVLRRAVALTTSIRDRHFELARVAVSGARDEAAGARRIVLLITLIALGIAVLVAWHLTRTVIGPVRQLTRGANAIRQGQFDQRIDVASHDELGELAAAFNQMADDLSEFRRTNIGEVVRAKNTLEATLEALPDAVVLLDASGRVQSMNRAAVKALASAGVFEPRRLEDLRIDGLDVSAVTMAIATGAGMATPVDLARTIRVEQEGAVQRLLPRVVPVPALTPQQGGAVLLLYDVTDLVRLDEMRSELVAVASHELQTPLTTLRMTLLMLQEQSHVLPERERELVATSLMGVEQLTETVHEFLDLTRIEAGELRLDPRVRGHVSRACRCPTSHRRTGKGSGHRAARSDERPAESLGGPAPPAGGLRQHPLERTQVHARVAGVSPSTVAAARRTKLVRATHSRSASPILARAYPQHFGRASSTSSFDSKTTRPRVAQVRAAQALASTCVGRSSSCTAAKSCAAQGSRITEPASRLRCPSTLVSQFPWRKQSSTTTVDCANSGHADRGVPSTSARAASRRHSQNGFRRERALMITTERGNSPASFAQSQSVPSCSCHSRLARRRLNRYSRQGSRSSRLRRSCAIPAIASLGTSGLTTSRF